MSDQIRAWKEPSLYGEFHIALLGDYSYKEPYELPNNCATLSMYLLHHGKVSSGFYFKFDPNVGEEGESTFVFKGKEAGIAFFKAMKKFDLSAAVPYGLDAQGVAVDEQSLLTEIRARLPVDKSVGRKQAKPSEAAALREGITAIAGVEEPKPAALGKANCVICSEEFVLEKKRGRPWQKCPKCRAIPA